MMGQPGPARVPSGHRRLGPSRWRGQAGRLEVWYVTATDPATGTGLWLHHELVAPHHGGPAHGLGWVALFPPDQGPVWRRFGPGPVTAPDVTVEPGPAERDAAWFAAAGVEVGPERLVGEAPGASWDLTVDDSGAGRPVWTFPRWAWDREVLPAAQVLAGPDVRLSGPVEVDGARIELDAVPAGSARIFGHGNANRWGWLHADLGDGDVLELVTAVSTRPGLRWVPPATFAQLRLGGCDRFQVPLLPGPVRLGLPRWSVTGVHGRSRLRVEVEQPPERTISVSYADPDGARSTCANSEVADAEIVLERWAGRWRTEAARTLIGTAHAEVGLR